MIKNIIKITIFAAAIFLLAVSVWYSPVLFKGYVTRGAGTSIIFGRNLAQTGIYGSENDLNVLLSSNLVKDQAHISASGNKFTAVVYGEIFKKIRHLSENELLILSIAIHAFTLIIFTLIILYLFGFKISLIFSLIYILLPFNWQITHSPGSYEFPLLFFAFFFFFYLCGLKQKHNYLFLIPAGIFLGLTCLTKEAFLLFIPFFFVYLWRKNPKRFLLYIFIPFLILFSYFWLPNVLTAEGGNTYLLIFTDRAPEELKSADFGWYGHLFPDPYTYHFNKEEFLKIYQNRIDNQETNFYTKASLLKTAANNGFRPISFLERIKAGLVLFLNHSSRFFSLEDVGGPFIFLLMLLGIYNLRQKDRYLWGLSLGWILSVVFLFSFVVLVGRRHLMDFGWILALWTALGLAMVVGKTKSKILKTIIVLVTLYGLVVANHAAWDTLFEGKEESYLKMQAYTEKIKELNIPDQDVIAISKNINIYRLNYLTNKSLVYFREKTIRNLLDNGELTSAFEKFKVKYILGYSDELSKKIIEQTPVNIIARSSVEIVQIKTSPTKMWFLNLVK